MIALLSQRQTETINTSSQNFCANTSPLLDDERGVLVPGVSREIAIKIASTPVEWEAAFRLIRENYLRRKYDSPSHKLLRFTPFHALPDTTVFVARTEDEVLATFTLVPDNYPLGLPLDSLYQDEVDELRNQGRRIGEVTSLAATGLNQREFLLVFTQMIRVLMQYHLHHGGDTWVITCNPRHSDFYCKTIGFQPLGPRRAYGAVEGHPAEAYWVTPERIRSFVPGMYQRLFGQSLSDRVLQPCKMPIEVIRYLASQSSQFDALDVEQVLRYIYRSDLVIPQEMGTQLASF